MILTLMVRRAKGIELMIFFNNQFKHIWFKCDFDFENVALTKVGYIYLIKGMNAQYI
jgi:hypothetical protein